ncbi:aminoglycoside phosphotransferase family protein [Bacillus sp. JCM 19041]|uniref:aminoglycoside phosphotransferase family protein n=1 Tax=Bacillus sp. JCM 19041 TaxID=1460637 RepID=UPI0006D067B1
MDLDKPIASGNTAQVYRSNNDAIKLFNDDLPETEATKEATKHRVAYAQGLPVPKIYDVTKVNGKPAIVMEYIEGKTLGEMACADQSQIERYMTLSVGLQQQIHKIVPSQIETMKDKLKRQIQAATPLNKKQKSTLITKLELFIYNERLCHGDFHLFNLIVGKEDQITIIDWVDASIGDPRADVYRTYLLYSQHFSDELAEMYMRIYCETSHYSKEEIFEWAPIIAGARLAESVTGESVKRLVKIVCDSI